MKKYPRLRRDGLGGVDWSYWRGRSFAGSYGGRSGCGLTGLVLLAAVFADPDLVTVGQLDLFAVDTF